MHIIIDTVTILEGETEKGDEVLSDIGYWNYERAPWQIGTPGIVSRHIRLGCRNMQAAIS